MFVIGAGERAGSIAGAGAALPGAPGRGVRLNAKGGGCAPPIGFACMLLFTPAVVAGGGLGAGAPTPGEGDDGGRMPPYMYGGGALIRFTGVLRFCPI